MEFWKGSDYGFTCGAFTSQIIEFSIWFYKRLHFLHANGNWAQIPKLMELFVAATEGAMKHNIPNFHKIQKKHKEELERWWIKDETTINNNRILKKFSGLHQYFVKLLKNVDPEYQLDAAIIAVTNKNRHEVMNRVLRKHLRKLGYEHSTWRSRRLVINENDADDMDDMNVPVDAECGSDDGSSSDADEFASNSEAENDTGNSLSDNNNSMGDDNSLSDNNNTNDDSGVDSVAGVDASDVEVVADHVGHSDSSEEEEDDVISRYSNAEVLGATTRSQRYELLTLTGNKSKNKKGKSKRK